MTIKKSLLIACAILAAIVTACILVYRLLTGGHVDPLTLLLLAAVIAIILPMVRTNFFPSAKDCEAELDFHIRRQDTFIQQQISDKLGPQAYQRVGAEPEFANENPADYLLSLLAPKERQADADLRFALLVTLSRYYEKTGDPGAAIRSLTEALQSRPQDFVACFRLARNFEWQGNPSQALGVYRRILDTPAGLSHAMIKLTRRRIEELEKG